MSQTNTVLKGTIYGKTIELEDDSGLPEGQAVTVEIRAREGRLLWWERFAVDPAVTPGKLVVKGTRLLADELVQLVENGLSDQELMEKYEQLSAEDAEAIREYSRIPTGLRRSFGGWADDPEGLDEFLEWNRQQRKQTRPGIDA